MNFDKEALGRLWDETTPKLFGYLVNVTRNKALAEDLLQNTWLKAIEALPRYRDRGLHMSSWLFAIARNECLQHFRKAGREVEFDLSVHDRADADDNLEHNILIDQAL